MKNLRYILFILVIFFKTGNVLSDNNLFNVNNIEVVKNSSSNNDILANKAIKKGFKKLINRVLLKKDFEEFNKLKFNEIKELVLYYQIAKEEINEKNETVKKYNVIFDKEKLHTLFHKKGIAYSDILKNDLFILPILIENNEVNIYSKNFFYDNWNVGDKSELIEFILPQENIEIIQRINLDFNSILDVDIRTIFEEYSKKNLALILIEKNNQSDAKIFLKTYISQKNINRNIIIKRLDLNEMQFNQKIILNLKSEIINIVKSQNLIDVRVPSFINIKFQLNKKNNLVELDKRIKNIDLIENIFVQELNNEYVLIKLKYLGNIDKIINELKTENILLSLEQEEWILKMI